MDGHVDVHSHVLWGIDDGARTLDESLEMLRRARAAGTRVLFATPHICPGMPFSRARRALRERRLEELRGRAPDGLELRAGWEVTPSATRLRPWSDLEPLRLEGTSHILLDGPQNSPWTGDDHLLRLVARIRAHGLVPIVAHPERRASPRWPAADPDIALRLRDAGALLQLDASGISGHDGRAAQADARRLLRAGLYDLIGSDAHGARPDTWPELEQAHADAELHGGAELAERLRATAAGLVG